ncbi:MAG: ABC transporter ATP-binding protein [Bacteroidota bacterium]
MIEARDLHVGFLVQQQGVNSLKDFLLSFGMRKPFVRKPVLKGIDLEIHRGECVGIIGLNGSGKSTLLRVIAGIITPEKGTMNVHGEVAPLLALGVGLEPDLTGYENINMLATLMGLSKRQIKGSVDSIIEFSGLSDEHINMQVKRYSTGMMARLAFAISVAEKPEILIVDEALAVGDLGFQRKCAARINEIRDEGSTIVYVAHHIAEIKRICTRAICIHEGKIVMTGPVDEALDFYKSSLADPHAKR